jgi:DNA-directed RNA polymerase specialized sigma24 family protein
METQCLTVQPAMTQELQFAELYEKCFPAVARFIGQRKGSFADAKDIFHDALIIYHEKSRQRDFAVETAPEAYVLGITRHLWLRKFADDRRKITADDQTSYFSIPEDNFPTINENRLLLLLERSGEKCLTLLRSFYFEKSSIQELKLRFGFRSEHSASVQKYKCIEKIRETIKQKSIAYDDFLE